MHDDHFEVIFFISKVDKVLNTAVGLHDEVNEVLVDDVQVRVKDLFQFLLLFFKLLFHLNGSLFFSCQSVSVEIVQFVHDQFNQP
jgi:hypothetical protein